MTASLDKQPPTGLADLLLAALQSPRGIRVVVSDPHKFREEFERAKLSVPDSNKLYLRLSPMNNKEIWILHNGS